MSEISMTPLMDLSFLLLITFIITFPLMEFGIPVNLPGGKADELKPGHVETVTLDARGRLYLNDKAISLEELKFRMTVLRRTAPATSVMVRADEAIRYGEVVGVLRALREARISKMALVTQEGRLSQP
jgi:biopolymer transport protein ExbD